MRKRVIGILLLLSVAGTLAGCSELNITAEEKEPPGLFDILPEAEERINTLSPMDSYDMYDYIDPETGVHYLVYSDSRIASGITPRLNADGSLMVDETVSPDDSMNNSNAAE